ncbi:MAG TPA: hypothetical protein VM364_00610 [Vicinamibacterales bacterium]|nr:hypothetical protein [Vicinamibacterales bacterium]
MKTIRQIADITPDPHNANKGTKRGHDLLERSIERNGAGRSIVVDRHGVIIAGNKTWEMAGQAGLDVEVVRTDGRKLVVVQRMDLDLASGTDARARELAIADNRTSEVSLDWDPNVLLHHVPGVSLSEYFFDRELARILGEADEKGELAPLPDNTKRTRGPSEECEKPEAGRSIEPDAAAAPAHDPADEDQTICPECGHTW